MKHRAYENSGLAAQRANISLVFRRIDYLFAKSKLLSINSITLKSAFYFQLTVVAC